MVLPPPLLVNTNEQTDHRTLYAHTICDDGQRRTSAISGQPTPKMRASMIVLWVAGRQRMRTIAAIPCAGAH